MSTSTDRGLTWSTPIPTAGHDKGLGGQSVALSNGTVVVPFFSLNGKIEAFTSTNRGASCDQGRRDLERALARDRRELVGHRAHSDRFGDEHRRSLPPRTRTRSGDLG